MWNILSVGFINEIEDGLELEGESHCVSNGANASDGSEM